jgi:hypothetical protein
MADNGQDFKTVDLQNLKKIIDTILDRMVNKLKVNEVTIEKEQDLYWDVPSKGLFLVREDQPQLDIGSLSDDWEFLQSILKDREHAVSLMLIHVAPLLRYIGEKIGQ